jgi:hypothetical protein
MAHILGSQHAVTAVRKGDVSGSGNVPAILWLALLLIGVWSVRNGRLPDPRSMGMVVAAVGAIVLVGSVVPRVAVWALFALLFASVIGGAPTIAAFVNSLARNGVTLSLNPGAQPHG